MASPGLSKRYNSLSPRSLYVREVASLYDEPDETFQSGGKNCSERAIIWKSKAGKYRNSAESCTEFKYLTDSTSPFRGQRENNSLK